MPNRIYVQIVLATCAVCTMFVSFGYTGWFTNNFHVSKEVVKCPMTDIMVIYADHILSNTIRQADSMIYCSRRYQNIDKRRGLSCEICSRPSIVDRCQILKSWVHVSPLLDAYDKTMNVIKSDNQLVLKSSTQDQLKHSCVEYCVEIREQFTNVDRLVVAMSMLTVAYLYLVNGTVQTWLKLGLVSVLLSMLALRFFFKVRNESLLIIAPIGLQLTTTYMTGHQQVFSLPWHSITDILIVDVIHTQKVLYYLAIKTSQNGLVTLFQKSRPRLHFLEIIYKDVYRLLENNKHSRL